MRYWILFALLNGLFTLVIYFAAPEMFESKAYYAGVTICALIALVITWRDPPGMLDKVLLFLFTYVFRRHAKIAALKLTAPRHKLGGALRASTIMEFF